MIPVANNLRKLYKLCLELTCTYIFKLSGILKALTAFTSVGKQSIPFTAFGSVSGVASVHIYREIYENTPIEIYIKFHLQKLIIFRYETLIFFVFLPKTYTVDTR